RLRPGGERPPDDREQRRPPEHGSHELRAVSRGHAPPDASSTPGARCDRVGPSSERFGFDRVSGSRPLEGSGLATRWGSMLRRASSHLVELLVGGLVLLVLTLGLVRGRAYAAA